MPSATAQSTWDARIARARELASIRPAARDLLLFYATLAEYQRGLAGSAGDAETFGVERVIDAIPDFLAWLRQNGRSDLAASVEIDSVASGFSRKDASGAANPAEQFVIESLLQAFAEHLENDDAPPSAPFPMRCPRCSAPPVAAVLREEGHGAKRLLLCALCLQEWECLRMVCPACGEQEFDKLAVYTAEQFTHVRIDACDRCHHYIKTIDLSKDGLAVPCVDDIASVSLDLWARERGYTRIRQNVFGF
jgi:formate dehydrogenase maturation protein FdhE